MTIRGQVFMDGKLAEDGVKIEALIGDRVCGTSSVQKSESPLTRQKTTGYSIVVDSEAQTHGCGTAGQTVDFRIDGQAAGGVSWQDGATLTHPINLGNTLETVSALILATNARDGDEVEAALNGESCASARVKLLDSGALAFEEMVIAGESDASACGRNGMPIDFSLNGQQLHIALGWPTLLPVESGSPFLVLYGDSGNPAYVGKAFVDGKPAHEGEIVKVAVGETTCGETTIRPPDDALESFAGEGVFMLAIDNEASECRDGRSKLQFWIGDRPANENVFAKTSGLQLLKLTAGSSDFIVLSGSVGPTEIVRDGDIVVAMNGERECGRAEVRTNEFGRRIFTDLIETCVDSGRVQLPTMELFLGTLPLSVGSRTTRPIPGIEWLDLGARNVPKMTLQGAVFINGEPASPTTEIRAMVDGVSCGESSVVPHGYGGEVPGNYSLSVIGGGAWKGCGRPGSPVQFVVDGVSVQPRATWEDGESERLDLIVGDSGFAIFDGEIRSYRDLPNEGTVRALINGKECGKAEYHMSEELIPQHRGTYFANLTVASDGSVPGCGRDGDEVQFVLDDQQDGEEVTFDSDPAVWVEGQRMEIQFSIDRLPGIIVN